jgi:hypothetical protein
MPELSPPCAPRTTLAACCLLTLNVLSGAAQAQPAPLAMRLDPLNAQAPVPALKALSSLKPTGPSTDAKVISWREANDNVVRIGGWRVYARDAQTAAPPQKAPLR